MKKILSIVAFLAIALCANADDVMTKKSDGTYVVNTTELCRVRGFKGYTPLEVHIKSNKVVKIVALENRETPKYYQKVLKALEAMYVGSKVSKAAEAAKKPKVDGTTGATFSSKAVQQNVKAALAYYKAHK